MGDKHHRAAGKYTAVAPPMGVMGSGILFVSRPVGLRRSVLAVVCDISWGSFWGNSKFMLGQQGFYKVYKRAIAVTIDKSPEMGTSSRPRSFLVARLAHVLPLPLFLHLYPSKGSGMASMCIIGIIVGLFIYGECCLVADVSRLWLTTCVIYWQARTKKRGSPLIKVPSKACTVFQA